MKILSPAFADGAAMPARYTADGDNHSPPLVFQDVPAAARSLVLTVETDASPADVFTHWVMFDVDPRLGGLAQAEIAGRFRDGLNSFRELGYTGPHDREQRTYVFRLYAVDTRLGLPNGSEIRKVMQAMVGHVIASDELRATYQCTAELPSAALERTKGPIVV